MLDAAFELRSAAEADDAARPFLSFEMPDTSRIVGNAATAYLSLGRVEKVEHQATTALGVLHAYGSRSAIALTKLDLAAASLLGGRSAEPDRAAAEAADAVAIAGGPSVRGDRWPGR